MPEISVIVPIYNAEFYLSRCIDSIIAQTFTDFALILVDDGSPDKCGDICEKYAEKDNRICVIHKNNGGLSDARNVGIDWTLNFTNCQWISFIDSDDWVHPQYLEKLISSVKETNCNISVVRYEKTTTSNKYFFSNAIDYQVIDTERFYCSNSANATIACGKLYKISDFEIIRFPVGRLHEDEYTTYKILFKYTEIVYIDEPLYYYFVNPSSIMGSQWKPKRLDLLDAIEENLVFFSENNYSQAYLNRLEMMKKSICVYMDEISKSSNEDYKRKIYPTLRHKLRKYIRICKKHHLYSFSTDKWAFSLAHPILMREYWMFITIKNKLKKRNYSER